MKIAVLAETRVSEYDQQWSVKTAVLAETRVSEYDQQWSVKTAVLAETRVSNLSKTTVVCENCSVSRDMSF